ncbi:MAG: imidazole glycerol phosphate synthase subunit HisF [Chitinophagales bacterium]|nr:imidazole glycerol phosphate synthase subunit HisF [Chitinophagales bacterium]
MLLKRVIPVLLLQNDGLVKTKQFSHPQYIGDPINAVKIFNEKEVDELVVLDIDAARKNRKPNFTLIKEIASECFMPLAYGGGIQNMNDVNTLIKSGVEKVILNTSIYNNPSFIREVSDSIGASSTVVCIDYKIDSNGNPHVYSQGGSKKQALKLEEWIPKLESLGAGEILLQHIDGDGMYSGYDLETAKKVSKLCQLPIILCGGASKIEDFKKAFELDINGAAAGSLFVYYTKKRGILINYPDQEELKILNTHESN